MIFLTVSKRKAEYLLRAYPELVKEESAPDGRGFTSVGVLDTDIERAWLSREINAALPWRYRVKPVKLRLFPSPKGYPSDALARALASTTYRKVRDRVTSQFGGRCQVCGHACFNARDRRISPKLFTTWLHSRHPNPKKKMGMREILGVASVCESCLGPLTLANDVPCDHVAPEIRKSETQKSVQRLATHNQLSTAVAARVIRKSILDRQRHLDNCFWVEDFRWLTDQRLVTPDEMVLSRGYLKKGFTLDRNLVALPPTNRPTSDKATGQPTRSVGVQA